MDGHHQLPHFQEQQPLPPPFHPHAQPPPEHPYFAPDPRQGDPRMPPPEQPPHHVLQVRPSNLVGFSLLRKPARDLRRSQKVSWKFCTTHPILVSPEDLQQQLKEYNAYCKENKTNVSKQYDALGGGHRRKQIDALVINESQKNPGSKYSIVAIQLDQKPIGWGSRQLDTVGMKVILKRSMDDVLAEDFAAMELGTPVIDVPPSNLHPGAPPGGPLPIHPMSMPPYGGPGPPPGPLPPPLPPFQHIAADPTFPNMPGTGPLHPMYHFMPGGAGLPHLPRQPSMRAATNDPTPPGEPTVVVVEESEKENRGKKRGKARHKEDILYYEDGNGEDSMFDDGDDDVIEVVDYRKRTKSRGREESVRHQRLSRSPSRHRRSSMKTPPPPPLHQRSPHSSGSHLPYAPDPPHPTNINITIQHERDKPKSKANTYPIRRSVDWHTSSSSEPDYVDGGGSIFSDHGGSNFTESDPPSPRMSYGALSTYGVQRGSLHNQTDDLPKVRHVYREHDKPQPVYVAQSSHRQNRDRRRESYVPPTHQDYRRSFPQTEYGYDHENNLPGLPPSQPRGLLRERSQDRDMFNREEGWYPFRYRHQDIDQYGSKMRDQEKDHKRRQREERIKHQANYINRGNNRDW